MRRRELIALLGAAAALSPEARAQQPNKVARIGLLIPFNDDDKEARTEISAFREEFRKHGWVEGVNARVEYRWTAGDLSRISTAAKELVVIQPDVILARSTPVTAALLRETKTVPIVFVNVSDPVGAGFVASMSRPGGNATGFTNVEASLGGKWVQLLKELNPQLARLAVVYGARTSPGGGQFYLSLIQDAAQAIGVETEAAPVGTVADIESVVEAFAREPNRALVVQPVTTTTNRKLIISLASRYRLPAVYAWRSFVGEGGLAAYGLDLVDQYRRAAGYVDRILRGNGRAILQFRPQPSLNWQSISASQRNSG